MLKRSAIQFNFYESKSAKITYQRLDNESSGLVEKFLKSKDIFIQYVPPNTHRANKAERAIREGKNHLIACFATAHPDFPLTLWDEILPQAEITLNLLREFTPNPSKSAYEGLYGNKYDFLAHPIAPVGALVVVHEKPKQRGSWDSHGVKAYYLGPALSHYRSWRTWIITTQTQRVSDTLAWFLEPLVLPGSSPFEMVHAAITDLTNAIRLLSSDSSLLPSNHQPFNDTASTATQALTDLINMFQQPPVYPEQRVFNEQTPVQTEQRVLSSTLSSSPLQTIPPPPLIVDSLPCDQQSDPQKNGNDASSPTVMVGTSPLGNSVLPIAPIPLPSTIPLPTSDSTLLYPAISDIRIQPPPRVHRYVPPRQSHRELRINPKQKAYSTISTSFSSELVSHDAIEQADAEREFQSALAESVPPSLGFSGMAKVHAALNLTDDGKPITYSNVKNGPHAVQWQQAESEEYSRLTDTETIKPMHVCDLPSGRKSTYYNPQLREKINSNGDLERRVRGTIGGDRIDYPGEVSARTADMEVVKILINSALSDDENLMVLDIKDYYLGTPLDTTEFISIDCKFIPEDCMIKYNLHQYVHNGRILHSVHKGMYGLPQAGALSQKQLVKHLETDGYYQSKLVPCLFIHRTNSIRFTLIVDDFLVKYKALQDAQHLITTLQKLYTLKIDMEAKKYIGLFIEQDRTEGTISLSMPNLIPKLIQELQLPRTLQAASPGIYLPPNYGKNIQYAPLDTSEPLSPADTTRLQKIVGTFLYYGRAVDHTVVTATAAISSEQAHPTDNLLKQADRLLAYGQTYPDNKLIYKKSDMVLKIHSDVSYLSRSKSRSVAGGYGFMGNKNDDDFLNGGIYAFSKIIDVVVASVSEGEYGAVFLNAQTGEYMRNILEELGHAQPPTTIYCDNECAVGLANDTVKIKRSKSIDMRFHWIRDRINQGHFIVQWIKGTSNLADFFTKALPVHLHQSMMPKFVYIPPRSMAHYAMQRRRRHCYRAKALTRME